MQSFQLLVEFSCDYLTFGLFLSVGSVEPLLMLQMQFENYGALLTSIVCSALQCHAIPCNAMQCSTVLILRRCTHTHAFLLSCAERRNPNISIGSGLYPFLHLHRSPTSRKRRRKGNPVSWDYNWTNVFSGNIDTGTWPTKLGLVYSV
jgi:hypothetical protein